ncbi:unnamed protein product [Clonostachys rhizophaga]|uniref:Class E vacuolar protein-sorting machinery protein HSE1 n=1 Tax=Clonostachys rhizophaga TaxID=160324 RepID=A0A9N9VMI0_9HYPO|nr:unnamed protein product [Clonostachys rhizophaga]
MARGTYLENLPELVRDSRLEATFGVNGQQAYTIHHSASHRSRATQEKWVVKRTLGEGGQGTVSLEVGGNAKFRAVKRFAISDNEKQSELHRRELIAIFKFSQARYSELFVKSYGWYTSDSHIHIAMEYMELGDLQKYLSNSSKCQNHRLPEIEAQCIATQVLEGLSAMHKEGFSHRDLKPANILIQSHPPDPWWVKLADFGISKRGGDMTELTAIRGTPNFLPPELLGFGKGGKLTHSFAIDMWCLGETLFRILSGRRTFEQLQDVVKYCTGRTTFPTSILQKAGASEKAIRFVSSLMLVNPEDRLAASSAGEHEWLQSTVLSKARGSPQSQVEPPQAATDGTPYSTQISTAPSAHWTAVLPSTGTVTNRKSVIKYMGAAGFGSNDLKSNISTEPSASWAAVLGSRSVSDATPQSFMTKKAITGSRLQPSPKPGMKRNPITKQSDKSFRDFARDWRIWISEHRKNADHRLSPRAIVISPYPKLYPEDITLSVGDYITFIAKLDDTNWSVGINQNGDSGTFPHRHLRFIEELVAETTHNGSNIPVLDPLLLKLFRKDLKKQGFTEDFVKENEDFVIFWLQQQQERLGADSKDIVNLSPGVHRCDNEDSEATVVEADCPPAPTPALKFTPTPASTPLSMSKPTPKDTSKHDQESIPESKRTGITVQALQNYTANENEELSFNVGQVISITDFTRTFWWMGELDGKRGLIPVNSNYVRIHSDTLPPTVMRLP